MKKRSIAKVMAAVMLLSLAAAPAAEAASFKSGAAGNAVLSGAMVQSVDKGKSYYDLLNDNSSNNSVRGTKSNPISVSVDLSDVLSDSGTVKESVKKEVVHIAAQVIATKYDANFGVISESGNSQVKASYEKNLNSGNSVSAVPALSSEQVTKLLNADSNLTSTAVSDSAIEDVFSVSATNYKVTTSDGGAFKQRIVVSYGDDLFRAGINEKGNVIYQFRDSTYARSVLKTIRNGDTLETAITVNNKGLNSGRTIWIELTAKTETSSAEGRGDGYIRVLSDSKVVEKVPVKFDAKDSSLLNTASRKLTLTEVLGQTSTSDLYLTSSKAEDKTLDLNNVYSWTLTNSNGDPQSLGKIETINARLFKKSMVKEVKATNAKYIRAGAFRDSKYLKKLTLNNGDTIEQINKKAFYNCEKLTSVKVGGKALKKVDTNAFGGSTDKTTLKIKIGANKTKYNKAVKKFEKSGVSEAKFSRISPDDSSSDD